MTMNTNLEPLFRDLSERLEHLPILARFKLLELARPSVRLIARRTAHAPSGLGESRIGGTPDVPLGFEWPRWTPSKDLYEFRQPWMSDSPVPLGFIAQIDLSAIPRLDEALPDSGWLYFFYDRNCEPSGCDPADRGCCRIIYANPDRSQLVRMEPPADAHGEFTADLCSIDAFPELTLPDNLAGIEYGTPEFESYYRLCDDLTTSKCATSHRLLGHPQVIQSPMELECQLASNGIHCGGAVHFERAEARTLESGEVDWRLLLQIDTDEDGPGWMWGDVGRIYFWLKKQDLLSLRFDDAWLIFQCC